MSRFRLPAGALHRVISFARYPQTGGCVGKGKDVLDVKMYVNTNFSTTTPVVWETSSAYLRAGPNSVRALERNRTQPLRSCSYPHVRPTTHKYGASPQEAKVKSKRASALDLA